MREWWIGDENIFSYLQLPRPSWRVQTIIRYIYKLKNKLTPGSSGNVQRVPEGALE